VLSVKSYARLDNPEGCDGKFVLLTKGKDLHLVLSPIAETPYHANIVLRYLDGEGLGKAALIGSTGLRFLTKGWKVQGGGYYKVEPWAKIITLHGKSTAFGKYQAKWVEPFEKEIPGRLELEGFTLDLA
jgi:hypothetical protein